MSFSFEQLIHPQPSLTHVACISAWQVASAVVAATSSTVSTGSTRTSAKPISSKQDQVTHPATSSTVLTGSTRTAAKPISSKCKQDQATHPAQPPAKWCLLASTGSLSFRPFWSRRSSYISSSSWEGTSSTFACKGTAKSTNKSCHLLNYVAWIAGTSGPSTSTGTGVSIAGGQQIVVTADMHRPNVQQAGRQNRSRFYLM